MDYKTVIFLVTVLLAIVTITNLFTEEIGIALLIIIIPITLASFLTLMMQRYYEIKTKGRKKISCYLLVLRKNSAINAVSHFIYQTNIVDLVDLNKLLKTCLESIFQDVSYVIL